MELKRRLVGTRTGQLAQEMRKWLSLRRVAFSNPEKASAIANSIIADRLVTRLCRPGATFLDIGGHIGAISSAVQAFDPSVRILVVEAEPGKAQALRDRFPAFQVHDVAVSDTPGTAEFYVNPERSGYNSLAANDHGRLEVIRVAVRTLDDLFPGETVDVIKIDIEGAELGALRGGAGLIRRSRPTMMFESAGTGSNSLGFSPDRLWTWLDENGFLVFSPDRVAHDAPPLTLPAFLDAHEYPQRTINFFAVATERRIEIRDRARQILGVG